MSTSTCPVCGTTQASPGTPCPSCSEWGSTYLSDAQTLELDAVPETMLVGGRYLVISELGRGGFGVVYRAMDRQLERHVAIKRIDLELPTKSSHRVRFEREARILARLDHPSIVPIYDAGLDGNHPYIVMKLVSGMSLAQEMDAADWDDGFGESRALDVVRQVASALAHAHDLGILHRDVKPSNILGDRDDRYVLADFGLSTATFMANITKSGVVVGTFRYMAPEIISGQAVRQSDLYSLGVVLYEMLFRTTCFEADSMQELVGKILHREPPLLAEPPAETSAAVIEILRKLLHKAPGDRFESAAALIAEIDRISSESGSPRRQPLDPALLTACLEHLEGQVEALRELCRRSVIGIDRFLEPFSQFLEDAAHMIGELQRAIRDGSVEPLCYALVPSLLNLSREVERLVRSAPVSSQDFESLAEGAVHRLRSRVLSPVHELGRRLEARRDEVESPDRDFFSFDQEPQERVVFDREEWIQRILTQDELMRHDAVLALLGDGLDNFQKAMPDLPETRRLEILAALWSQADAVLLEGRGRSKVIFEAALQTAPESELYKKYRLLYSLFKKAGDGYWDLELARRAIDDHSKEDRRIFRKSLLVHPAEPYRRDALAGLEPSDLWSVIANESVPIGWTLEIWRHVKSRVTPDFLKIFLVCIYDRLLQLDGPQGAVRLVEFAKELFEVDCFHEKRFFTMLTRIDELVRREAKRQGLLVDFDSGYVETLREFTSRSACRDQPVAGWGLVPLPVQRILARRGHFQHHFACHPIDPIALECLRHIVIREEISDFLKLYGINARLLTEVAREERLFQHENARYLLVANPKTSTFIVTKHIGYLRTDSLRKLRDSRDCNLFAREYATRILEKRDKYRSAPPTGRRPR